ncbi:MAG: glycosyltransferase family 39 protein [Ruminococcus sp.]|nr:glycosyltransferase family 39 protein [Ruminococcus sp.]
MAKHPFLSVTGMCFLLFFFGFCETTGFTTFSYVYAGAVMSVLFVLLIMIGRIGDTAGVRITIIIALSVLTAGGLFLMRSFNNSPAMMLLTSMTLLAAMCALMQATGTLSDRSFIMLMIAGGVMLRLTYDLYTGYLERQYDVGSFNWTYGHANYIEFWLKNGLSKLPDEKEILTWQYYHPPLHHWLMALLLKLLTSCGMEYNKACEALQILPMLYSSLTMVVSYRIFRWVRLRGLPLVIAMTIVCFHPAFIHMGGSFNNDMLCSFLMMLSIMFALRWYSDPTLKRIIPIALCVGLGMMTKLSGWMVAPAIAIMFLYVFVKNIRSWTRYIGQYAVFGVICAPLGLWWQIRNLIAFDMPLNYVPYGNTQFDMYCGDMSASERLFDFGNGQLSFVYVAYTDQGFDAPFCDYNPTVGLFKTAIFSEGKNGITDIHFPQIAVTGPILFWIGVVLGLLCFISFIAVMIRKDPGLDGLSKAFFSVLALTLLVSYYIFCFQFPFTCTMNIRYCIPLIPLFAMGLGLLLRHFGGKSAFERTLRYSVYALTAAFALMSCLLFAQLSLTTA